MTIARELAEFLVGTSSADLPRQAVEHAAMLIASTLASAAMGAGLQSSAIIRDLARERSGNPEASVWFDPGPKLPVSDAARVNAVMSDAAASDDSDLRNIVHAGTTLVSTALAMAERTGASGDNVLTAIVLGYEAAVTLARRSHPAFAPAVFMAVWWRFLAARLPRLDCCGSMGRAWRRPSHCRRPRSAG